MDNDEIREKQEKLRNILIKYGSEEYGDVILDEICDLFGYPNTCDAIVSVEDYDNLVLYVSQNTNK